MQSSTYLYLGAALFIVAAATSVHIVGFRRLAKKVKVSHSVFERSALKRLKKPSRVLVPLLLLEAFLPTFRLPSYLASELLHAGGIALIVVLAWTAVVMTYVFEDVVLARYRIDVTDNLKARRIHTQIIVLRRVAVAAISVVAIGMVLLTFGQVRALGTGLLASAGIVGIVAAVAAKPTATNVVAGIQIAISQPIRIDDVVVVDGHWGRIEEIALTYVVVRVWDMRRLVLPISYLITNPFENWTKSSSDILGWVLIDVDFKAPIEEIRQAFIAILASSSNWDKNLARLQVVSSTSTTMQIRALMSARDSSTSWDLQCEVRERLIDFIASNYPDALPRTRTEFTRGFQK